MTTEEYIASGLLEVYASGGLTEPERQEVERMAREHPEVREELDKIEAALEHYALLHAQIPPARLKTRILDAIPATGIENPTVQPTEPVSIPFSPAPETRTWNWLSAAAVILLLLSAGLNYYFYRNWQQAENSLVLAQTNNQQFAQNFKRASFEVSEMGNLVEVLQNTATKHVALKGLEKAPESEAMIHWDPQTKTVLLAVKKLPAAPTGKQYQLWALKDGQPINAGLLNPEDTLMGLQKMENIASAEAFALTLEPAGGSVNPTMNEMYLMGKM